MQNIIQSVRTIERTAFTISRVMLITTTKINALLLALINMYYMLAKL